MEASSGGPWTCAACTFINTKSQFLTCEMCASQRAPTDTNNAATPASATSTNNEATTRADASATTAAASPPRKRPRVDDAPKKVFALATLQRLPANPATVRRGDAAPVAVADADVPAHAPASLRRRVLPEALADALLARLREDERSWHRGTWTVFGKTSANARTTRTFRLDEADAREYHNEYAALAFDGEERGGDLGRAHRAPPELLEAAAFVRSVVAEDPAPSAARWRPSVAFGNRYEDGADHVGYHSDFLLSLGPRPIIAGLSLGATRTFRLRSADGSTVVSIPAPHNSLVVMRQDCQESWQHAVVKTADVRPHAAAGATRFSLTFRMARPDFAARARVECACGRVAALKAKNGAYYLTCNMAGGDASAKCTFYRRCDVAQREADRLRAEDAAALAAADG